MMTREGRLVTSEAGQEALAEGKAMLAELRAEEEQARFDKAQAPYQAKLEREHADWQRAEYAKERAAHIRSIEDAAARGSVDAQTALANIRFQEAAEARGRQDVLDELSRDISDAVARLDIDADSKAALMGAQSMAQFTARLHRAPAAVRRQVERSMQSIAAEASNELGYNGPHW